MIVGPIATPIGPTLGGTNVVPFGAAGKHPSDVVLGLAAALAPGTIAPMAKRLPATATLATVFRLNIVLRPFFSMVIQRHGAVTTLPPDEMALPMVAGPITVGPMTVETSPTLGAMKERPLP
ncbi:MAG: hypothetical protein QOJ23_3500 [Actinomycetota bacterium]|nr:hypothetical protein [Actinomycetota bacterium]MDQ1498074.1 hypothetical protein [Actinomycetota bacterium]MDQ1567111.1 hypothetical protein [Actinomycetota bacterium]